MRNLLLAVRPETARVGLTSIAFISATGLGTAEPGSRIPVGLVREENQEAQPLDPEAVRQCRERASLGILSDQHKLGCLYEAGLGVARDNVEAYIWIKLLCDQNRKYRQFLNEIANSLTVEELSKVWDLCVARIEEVVQRRREGERQLDTCLGSGAK